MLLVFPSDPLVPARPDPAFSEEVAAARAEGFAVGFAGLEFQQSEGVQLRVPPGSGAALYRGWMLRVVDYARLDAALTEHGYQLVNTTAAYEHCHLLPEWYAALGKRVTPRSIWFPGKEFDLAEVARRVAAEFGDAPVILKDYVKSRKHEWFDACFIRAASDAAEIARVVANFLRLQDDALVGGLVFREFVEFKRIGLHSRSRMPLVREFRFFVLDGSLITQAPYWGEGEYDGAPPDLGILAQVLPRVKSRFFAVDVAQKADGSWLVMELNDGGSAGVPEGGQIADLYRGLRARA